MICIFAVDGIADNQRKRKGQEQAEVIPDYAFRKSGVTDNAIVCSSQLKCCQKNRKENGGNSKPEDMIPLIFYELHAN